MATAEQRYEAATAYARRAIKSIEDAPAFYDLIDRYAATIKTEPYRNDLGRIEARWLRATNDGERSRVARDAELLADRVQETLPGAPQDRERTNLTHGEVPTATPATSYAKEVKHQAAETWTSVSDAAHSVTNATGSIGKWALIGGGLLVGWKLLSFLGQRPSSVRSARGEERALNTALARAASARNAGSRPPALSDTELVTWFERDRAHVELRDRRSGQTIVEWCDEEVAEAIEDGFLPHRWTQAAAHAAAFEFATQAGLISKRNAGGGQRREKTYSLRLTKGEIEALYFLGGRYASAQAFSDGLVPLDDSADAAIGLHFDRGAGPYRFQIRAVDVRRALRGTKGDGGDYGAIPNLLSPTVDWVLAQERETVS